MRGTLAHVDVLDDDVRFIPAYAGNAELQLRFKSANAVHPRVCGERVQQSGEMEMPNGSSPRMRGTLRTREQKIQRDRFIPAYAGNAAWTRGNQA